MVRRAERRLCFPAERCPPTRATPPNFRARREFFAIWERRRAGDKGRTTEQQRQWHSGAAGETGFPAPGAIAVGGKTGEGARGGKKAAAPPGGALSADPRCTPKIPREGRFFSRFGSGVARGVKKRVPKREIGTPTEIGLKAPKPLLYQTRRAGRSGRGNRKF